MEEMTIKTHAANNFRGVEYDDCSNCKHSESDGIITTCDGEDFIKYKCSPNIYGYESWICDKWEEDE